MKWKRVAVLVGLLYAVVGIVFALPATHVQLWRLGAWIVCAVAYAGHLGYERYGLRHRPGRAAWHVAAAVALGAFGLALGANVHALGLPSGHAPRGLLLLALILWPLLTAVPAFIVAFAIGLVGRDR
jgi:hypothetical protein